MKALAKMFMEQANRKATEYQAKADCSDLAEAKSFWLEMSGKCKAEAAQWELLVL